MKKYQIHYSDIELLIKLYSEKPSVPYIFDPNNRLNLDEVEETLSTNGSEILVNLGGNLTQFKGRSLDSFDLIIDFGSAAIPSQFQCEPLNYINHPKGGMRWLFQGSNLKSVLAFYNASGRRGKIVSSAIKLLSALGLKFLAINGTFKVHSKRNSKLKSSINECCDDYSVFMGTPGLQRSLLIALINGERITDFLKIPVNEATNRLIQIEKEALGSSEVQSSFILNTPKVLPFKVEKAMLTKNLSEKESVRTNEFSNLHKAYVVERLNTSRELISMNESRFWLETKNSLEKARFFKNSQLAELGRKGRTLAQQMDQSAAIHIHWAHGDFTPWNMLITDDKISLYDWEMFNADAPALFDLFHFHYQRGILMDRLSAIEIRELLDEISQDETLKKALIEKEIDFWLYHRFYLLNVVSYFIEVYNRQELNVQNLWQIQTWTNALRREISFMECANGCRESFILDLSFVIEDIPHAFLKFDYPNLVHVPESADLDIALRKEDVGKIVALCQEHRLVKRYHQRHKSFMSILEIHLLDGSFLSVDLIHQFKRKNLTFLDLESVLKDSSYSTRRVMIPSLKHDLAYAYAFYTLNHSSIPLRYFKYFLENTSGDKNEAVAYLNSNYNTDFQTVEEVLSEGHKGMESLKMAIKPHSFMQVIKGGLDYAVDTFIDLINNRGYIVTFTGVDGAGKSTIIELVKENVEKKYRKKVVLLRHRPGVLPILSAIKHGKRKAEKIAGDTLPRKGSNTSKISSALRFSYYYLDYLLGQVYVYFRYILRGKIVLYDRYYFDFIHDAKRSNIEVNKKLSKALYSFVVKPKLNIFLYAQPEAILARKQELNSEDIKELTQNYFELFKSLRLRSKKSRYTCIENDVLDNTLTAVLNEFSKVA